MFLLMLPKLTVFLRDMGRSGTAAGAVWKQKVTGKENSRGESKGASCLAAFTARDGDGWRAQGKELLGVCPVNRY